MGTFLGIIIVIAFIFLLAKAGVEESKKVENERIRNETEKFKQEFMDVLSYQWLSNDDINLLKQKYYTDDIWTTYR